MRRVILIGGIALAVILVGVLALVVIPGASTPETPANLRRASILPGDISITVSAAGSVEPEDVAVLYFPATASGVVEELDVDVGDRVSKGDVLAQLNSMALAVAHQQAQLEYDIQDLTNQRDLAPPDDNDLAGAQAEVGAASARLGDASTIDAEELEIARLQAEQGVHGFNAADINERAVQWRSTDPVANNANASTGIAWVQAEIARLQFEQMLNGPRPEDVAVASAEVGLESAQLQQLQEGASEFDEQRADVQMEMAQVAVDRADEQLSDVTLRSPFDGVVAVVNVQEGAPPESGVPAIQIIDDGVFHIEVEVDEVDISDIEVGQQAFVELDALPDRTLTGTVTRISPSAAEVEGIASYLVRVDLDPTDAPLLSGMTATVDIVIEQVASVLRVPNWAIRIDRQTGDAFVSIEGPDGGLIEVDVELGLRGDTYSQVVSGLDEGEEVVVSLERDDISFFGGEEE